MRHHVRAEGFADPADRVAFTVTSHLLHGLPLMILLVTAAFRQRASRNQRRTDDKGQGARLVRAHLQ